MPIFYHPEFIKDNHQITIRGQEYNHIKNAIRKKEGDEISITNGRGLLAVARLLSISDHVITLEVNKWVEKEKSVPRIALAFSLLKKHTELIVEKCTELGIYEFFPFISHRTIKQSYSNKLINRLERVAIAAMKQCDSVYLPKINPVCSLQDLLLHINKEYSSLILAWEEEKSCSLNSSLKKAKGNICLIIGPEGGFETNEVELARKYNTQIVSLGNHILRAETAAMVVSANTIFYQLQLNPLYY
jgi:16S rRNA (uracil1498-N3)-methyltransferase